MDWASFLPALVGAISAAPVAVWAALRHVRKTNEADLADSDIGKRWQGIVTRQDREAERLRDEIQTMRESASLIAKRLLELELENKVKQQVMRAMLNDLAAVKRDKLDPLDLQTDIYRGQM